MSVTQAFSQSYAEARGKFLGAVRDAGLDVESHPHPMLGRDGEALAMDVVRDGARDARSLLIVSSACHGVEGYCGSGVQVSLLGDAAWREHAQRHGVAVLYLHALNPYGFSWWRRVTHENVDLNRNFQDFGRELPRNTAYDEVSHLILPPQWPPGEAVDRAVADYIATRGAKAWQTAVSAGQYHHPEGLFYGGHAPTWSNQTLRHVLRDHGRQCTRLAWIDLHTGLGPSGHGERIYAGADEPATIQRARRWWGPQVTSIFDGSSASVLVTGLMWQSAGQECPQAEYTGIGLEYGTLPMPDVLNALRAEHWLENHPETAEDKRRDIKRRIRDAFYVDTDEWKAAVVSQAREAAFQAVDGLSAG